MSSTVRELLNNIDRNCNKLIADSFNDKLNRSSSVDYANHIKDLTSQIKRQMKWEDVL